MSDLIKPGVLPCNQISLAAGFHRPWSGVPNTFLTISFPMALSQAVFDPSDQLLPSLLPPTLQPIAAFASFNESAFHHFVEERALASNETCFTAMTASSAGK